MWRLITESYHNAHAGKAVHGPGGRNSLIIGFKNLQFPGHTRIPMPPEAKEKPEFCGSTPGERPFASRSIRGVQVVGGEEIYCGNDLRPVITNNETEAYGCMKNICKMIAVGRGNVGSLAFTV